MTGANVWPYHRAECEEAGCGWTGPYHLSPMAAIDDADVHNEQHANAAALEAELLAGAEGVV
jgi:hypothetical protein